MAKTGLTYAEPVTRDKVQRRHTRLARAMLACILLALTMMAPQGRAGPAPNRSPALRAALVHAMKRSPQASDDPYIRQVWLRVMSQRLKPFIHDAVERRHLLVLVYQTATQAGVSPELVLAIINVESGFQPYQVSATGAQGLMQIMPFWLHVIGKPGDNLFNPRTNLTLGCAILHYYLQRDHGNYANALAAYYGDQYDGRYPDRVLRLLAQRWYWH